MAKHINLEIYKKSTKTYEMVFTENGSAVDITDWTIYFTVKEKLTDSDINAKIKKDITSHEDAVGGITLIKLISSDTDLTIGNYHYNISYKDDEGNEGVLVTGYLQISNPVRQSRT